MKSHGCILFQQGLSNITKSAMGGGFGLGSGNEPYVGEEESRSLLLRELFEIHKRKEGPYNGVLAPPKKNVKSSQKHS
jgi:hypothetical protein